MNNLSPEHQEQVKETVRAEKGWLIPTIAFTYVGIIFGGGIAYGQMTQNTEELRKQRSQVSKIDVIQNDIEHIKKEQDRMSLQQQKIIELLQERK